jgi:Flp pilus assembly protein TadG
MKLDHRTARGEKGFAAVYVLFASLLLIPVAGLAIDFSMLYNVKGRLQSAVDAAAISAGYLMQRSTNLGDPTQVASIQDAAQRYFNANYPTKYWGSTQVSYSATPAQSPTTKIRTLTVQAQQNVPMLFMRVLGISQSSVAAQAVVTVRYVNMMIVVDRSGSVLTEGANSTITTVLNQFVANSATSIFVDGRDIVGMVTFGGAWRLDFAPITNFQTASSNIGTAINNIAWGNNGTNTADGTVPGVVPAPQVESAGRPERDPAAHRWTPQRVFGQIHIDGKLYDDLPAYRNAAIVCQPGNLSILAAAHHRGGRLWRDFQQLPGIHRDRLPGRQQQRMLLCQPGARRRDEYAKRHPNVP